MKKSLLLVFVVVTALLLSACLNYKAYDVPTEEEGSLVDEIAQIEQQLEDNDLVEGDGVVEEEIALPELGELGDLVIIEIDENEEIRLDVEVFDPDNDRVTYTFTPPLSDAGTWKTNYGDAGEYSVTLTATDGVHTTDQELLLVVNRVNVAPVIAQLLDLRFNEGDEIVINPEVNDPNNDAVSITISEPLAGGLWETDHTSAGEYEIFVTASDGELETTQSFMLYIGDVNEMPVLSGIPEEGETITINEGETVSLAPQVSDLDGDNVAISISEPIGDDGVWQTGFTDHGTYNIVIEADDGKDVVRHALTLVVVDVNMPPEIVDVSLATQ